MSFERLTGNESENISTRKGIASLIQILTKNQNNRVSHRSHNKCVECGITEEGVIRALKDHGLYSKDAAAFVSMCGDLFCPDCASKIHGENGYNISFNSGKCDYHKKPVSGSYKLKNGKSMCPSCAETVLQKFSGLEAKVNHKSHYSQCYDSEKTAENIASTAIIDEKPVQYGLEGKLNINNLDPHELHNELKKHVMGQEKPIEAISKAVADHYLKIDRLDEDKKFLLIAGPTGCGKTHTVKTISSLLNVPYTRINAPELTGAGYVGDKIKDHLYSYVRDAAKGDCRLAENGMVFIDEIDSKARKADGVNRDISGEDVQKALLPLMDSDSMELKPPEENGVKQRGITYHINPRKILFIFGGAFQDAYDGLKKKKASIGFTESSEKTIEKLTINETHLEKYLTKELIGRTKRVFMNKLTTDDIYDIMTKRENSIIEQMKRTYEEDYKKIGYNIKFNIEDRAIRLIAEKAAASGYGARDIDSMIENVVGDDIFELTKNNKHSEIVYNLTAKHVEEKLAV